MAHYGLDIHANLNYFDLGDANVDTQPNTRSGRVAGKFSPNYAIGVDLGLVMRF